MNSHEHARTDTPGTRHEPAPHQHRSIEVNGLKLHYLDYGTEGRRPLLFVHGGAAHAHWFDFVAGGFSADHHVRSLDLRGHGDSEWADPPVYSFDRYASDLARFVEMLDLRDFVLVGHSMGGMVSLVYSATHPGRVARLVLVDTTMQLSKEAVANLRDLGSRPAKDYASRDELVRRYRLQPEGPRLAPPEILRYVAQMSGRQMPEGHWQHKFDRSLYAIFERIDGKPYWDHVKIPALLVKGEHSNRMTEDIFKAIASRAPQIETVEVPASDHHITLDNPEGFVAAVRPFLAR